MRQRKTISGSVIVITGASSGIGRATALQLAREGATVVLASRQEETLREVARECQEAGGKALPVATDVTSEEQVTELARTTAEACGRIDVWINNAGVYLLSRFEDAPSDAFRSVIETNFFGTVHGARAVLPYFRRQGHGILINMASVLGKIGSPVASAYAASKFAVTGFSESLRMELRNTPDIHVCTVLPATIDTPLFQKTANFTGRAIQAMPPVHAPEQVARAIVHTIRHPRREVTVGAAGRYVTLRRMAPPLAERLIAGKIERRHFKDEPGPNSPGNLFQPMPQFSAVHGGWKDHRRSNVKPIALAGGALAVLATAGTALFLARRKRHVGRIRKTAQCLKKAVA